MKTTLIFAVVIGMALANLGRKCYICVGKECEGGLGKEMSCGSMPCGMSYDLSGSKVAKGTVDMRFCVPNLEENVTVVDSCEFWKNDKAASEYCICDRDLCNGEEPSCETRNVQHSEVSELLADKCAAEITKRKAAA